MLIVQHLCCVQGDTSGFTQAFFLGLISVSGVCTLSSDCHSFFLASLAVLKDITHLFCQSCWAATCIFLHLNLCTENTSSERFLQSARDEGDEEEIERDITELYHSGVLLDVLLCTSAVDCALFALEL